MQCGQRRAAIADKIVEPARRFPAIAELVEREREIGNAFLIARLAFQFLEAEPDERIPRSPQRQDANAFVDGGENLFGIFIQIARSGQIRYRDEDECSYAISPEHFQPEV